MLSRFFIERPIFANVIAIVTLILGAVSLWTLPVEQFPQITPPTVRVNAVYPGANAEVVADTVAAPIEQQVNGVENMLYMSSVSSSNGSYSLQVTFEIGSDLDDAQVQVQNRVSVAEPLLPEEVRRQGVTTRKVSPNIIVVISLTSPDNLYDDLFLSNYANIYLRDALSRIKGVGEVTVFGSANYSMRVWLDPERLKIRGLTTQDVVDAIREQNVQVAAGQIGQPPTPVGDKLGFQFTVTTKGRLSDVKEFEEIVIKTTDDSRLTRVKDVATVELGAQTYDQFNARRGFPTANIGIFQLPGSNAVNVVEDVRQAMADLAKSFPAGMKYDFPLDTTEFVKESIHEVYKTLFEAGILVLIVILVFLQDWRAVLVPATTVPVTIIGAFFAMALLGYTVNMLTLFGLVLAIGIVVDDAIVVVENAAHHIERGLEPKPATIKAMNEVLGPIIGITLVLMSVFLPSAFLTGITGQVYQQFALTIAATALISAINALSLKPAQCATWLRPPSKKKNVFARGFNAVYSQIERAYVAIVARLVRHVGLVMLLFAGLVAATIFWYLKTPTGFFPNEDQGYILIGVQLPDAASQDRTRDLLKKVDGILAETDGIADWISIGGFSFIDNSSAPNVGIYFVTFKPWSERLERGNNRSTEVIVADLAGKFSQIQDAILIPIPPPPIRGVGNRAGFEMQVQDRGGAGREALYQAVTQLVEDARGQTRLAGINTLFRAGVPQIYADIDREQVKMLDVPLGAVFDTLQAYLGSTYVNDFNKFGRVYQVRVQAEPKFRARAEDIKRLEVRNRKGEMIPLGTVANIHDGFGPQTITRYNLYPSAQVTGGPAPGTSSGQALDLMEQIADRVLPDQLGFEWTSMAFQEKRVGNEAIFVFVMATLLVYLVLAAQYESWFAPIGVIMVVPLGLLGAIAAVAIRGMDNNLYTQIGVVLIIALASKNAILIVEFARDARARGRGILEAAVEGARSRFRPILMTSFAFILGVVPLVVATGAGAAGRRALGTAVFGGMLAATILAVFFVPVFFVFFEWIEEWWTHKSPPVRIHPDEDEASAHA